MMDKFWEDILLGIENTTEAEWDKLFSDFEKAGLMATNYLTCYIDAL